MTVTGTDDQGAYVDSGLSILATQRPNVWVDAHTLVPVLAAGEHDTGVNAANAPKLASTARAATQRR